MMLTREEVEYMRPLTTLKRNIVNIRGEWVGIFSALRMLLDQDAALRAQLAKVTAERDEWHRHASSHLQALCEKYAEINGLEAQITAINEAML